MNRYTVRSLPDIASAPREWDDPFWENIPFLTVSQFRPESSSHRPKVLVKMVADLSAALVFFKVSDRYVRCTRTEYMSDVWNDSCVEWFVQPKAGLGYFNFEVNCGGALHASYVEDPTRLPGGALKKSTPLPPALGKTVTIFHSLPGTVDPEIAEPVEWYISMRVPFPIFAPFIGPIGGLDGQEWHANFNKCADQTSHPHWATWNPVSTLNFHRPGEFGMIRFEKT